MEDVLGHVSFYSKPTLSFGQVGPGVARFSTIVSHGQWLGVRGWGGGLTTLGLFLYPSPLRGTNPLNWA